MLAAAVAVLCTFAASAVQAQTQAQIQTQAQAAPPALQAAVQAAVPTLADGQAAYDAGRYADARRIWQQLAARGDSRAQYNSGLMFDLGRGGPPDAAQAYRYYFAAARTGLAEAQFSVASMIDSGVGMPRDTAQAALWMARAASHGLGRAQMALARMYASGTGVPVNLAVAAAWLRAAVAGGQKGASEQLSALARAPQAANAQPAAPEPVAPGPDEAVLIHDGDAQAELVWRPEEPKLAVRFFVEVIRLDGAARSEVFSGYADTSALLVHLPPRPARYAWRAYTVALGLSRYAAGPWTEFNVATATN